VIRVIGSSLGGLSGFDAWLAEGPNYPHTSAKSLTRLSAPTGNFGLGPGNNRGRRSEGSALVRLRIELAASESAIQPVRELDEKRVVGMQAEQVTIVTRPRL